MNIHINRYEIFLKVVETGNITKAAEALNYTQSGVSHAISALEKEVGFSLFMRSNNGVILTDNGHRILDAVQHLVNQQRNFEQTVFSINHAVAGTIRIGTFTSVSAQWLPKIIRLFQKKYPSVEFELLDGNYGNIITWIAQGKIDCGFLTSPIPDEFSFIPLMDDPMMVLMCRNHPLAKKKELTLDDITNEPFIVPVKGCDNDFQTVFQQSLKPINIKYSLNDDISVMAMVEEGFGICILPELLTKNFMFDLEIRSLTPPKYRTIGIASRPLNSVSLVTRTFLEYLSHTDIWKKRDKLHEENFPSI